jgi:hypothetical protein
MLIPLELTDEDRRLAVAFFSRGQDEAIVARLTEMTMSGENDDMPMLQMAAFVRQEVTAAAATSPTPQPEA